jgi:hypothetical protein
MQRRHLAQRSSMSRAPPSPKRRCAPAGPSRRLRRGPSVSSGLLRDWEQPATRLATAVLLVGRSPTVVPTVDASLGELIRQELEHNGVEVLTGLTVRAVAAASNALEVLPTAARCPRRPGSPRPPSTCRRAPRGTWSSWPTTRTGRCTATRCTGNRGLTGGREAGLGAGGFRSPPRGQPGQRRRGAFVRRRAARLLCLDEAPAVMRGARGRPRNQGCRRAACSRRDASAG